MTVKVVTDSSCDLPQELVDQLGIAIVPLTIRFGDTEYVDRQDLSPEEFWAKCAASPTLPETAAPSPGAFEATFRAAAADGHNGVLAIMLSGALSATIQSAQLAAAAVEATIPVRVVDSRLVTGAMGIIVINAARLAADGEGLDQIATAVEDQARRTKLYATIDTLDNLRKGGRIGRAQAMVGSVLAMKPVIQLVDGAVEPESRQRTRAKSLRYLADKVKEAGRVENLMLLSADAPDYEELLVMLADQVPKEDILITNIGAVIGAHSGPRALAVAFQLPAS